MKVDKIFWSKNKAVIVYSASLAFFIFLLKWLELRFIVFRNSYEIYIGFIAIIFTALGIWLALKLGKPKQKTIIVEKEIFIKSTAGFVQNTKAVSAHGLSVREMEVLQLMSQGLSNNEIAEKLFLSPNTIKTHSSRLYEKLGVKRRTQAVEKARHLLLIP